MDFDLGSFLHRNSYSDDQRKYFDGFSIVDGVYKKSDDVLIIKAESNTIIPYELIEDLKKYLTSLGVNNVKVLLKAKDNTFDEDMFNSYLQVYSKQNHCFNDGIAHKDDSGFQIVYLDEESMGKDYLVLDDLKLFFYDYGFRQDISLKLKPKNQEIKEERVYMEEKQKPVSSTPKFTNTKFKYKPKTYTDVCIDDMTDSLNGVKFYGEIFKVDERTTRTNMLIQNLYVKDKDNAVVVKLVENRKFTRDVLKENTVGKCAYFYGNYHFDTYFNDYLFEPDHIEFVEKEILLKDDAEVKRVELHTHTKMSEMDGVCSPDEIVKAAYKLGHRGVAITDHMCIQGFHKAMQEYQSIKKKDKNADFKVLYGCEMNLVSEKLDIVYNPNDDLLSEKEYVVFDLETTGLSLRHDYIIEFGAVLMYKGLIRERKDFFIKPPIDIPRHIEAKTHISNDDVKDARTFKECKDEILDFIKDRVLVAHNASFDFGFLNEELKRINEPQLTNSVIDTLDYSKSLFKNRRAYRLGNIANLYHVEYDDESAHRADYDAEVLANIFNLMLRDTLKSNISTLNQLANFQDETAFTKNRTNHIIAIAKNRKGMHDLFRLITISNTETLSISSKSQGKGDGDEDVVSEPRIFRSAIEKYRKNLLIGSACCNGEVFDIASTKNEEKLDEAISFYDYIEIQPLENYRHLVEDRSLFTEDRLKVYLLDIIKSAQKQNKIIVATGDVHYVTQDEKILRDIYIRSQGIGGVRHPLFVFDKEKRASQITPDQRFLNTKEMLDAFKWLNDDQLAYDMVITNTNKILDMCEDAQPFVDGLYTPKIDDAIAKARSCNIIEEPFVDCNEVISADEYLKRLVYYNAHNIYGDDLDEVIAKRIDKELNAIIGNGYGVIYFVCHLMVKRSNNDGYVVGSRGSVGSSLVATFSGITEVNPLAPHYVCPKCHHIEWTENVASGYDLPDKNCPKCKEKMKGEGQNIPFETFLGFNGDKTPDIDLNFSGDYQPKAHLFTREIFGENNVFRAGTISTVAEKTAFGYVAGYCEDHGIVGMSRAQKERLASGCVDVKRTTGQHAGGIVVLPDGMDIEDITPIQYPANDIDAKWRSTHFEYHDFESNLLKFDILGHVDPTAMKLFGDISGIDIKSIPMNDPKVLSLFSSSEALNIVNPNYHEDTGACGLPEFGTLNTRNTIKETKPKVFSELVQISGLSHGTDVWRGNAQELIRNGIPLKDVIGCRDDIMGTLLGYKLEPIDSFTIMEKVRKGKGLTPEEEKLLEDHSVPRWYIDSCKKIKYMFPKAHAVAYCIMAVRVAWFKVYYPAYYYVQYFSLRSDAYELSTMMKDADSIYYRLRELSQKINSKDSPASKKEKDIFDTLEVAYEMASRGYKITNVDLNKSLAKQFTVNPDNPKEIIPSFMVIDGLGENVAESIVNARNERPFMSKEDLANRTGLSGTLLKKLEDLGALNGLDESNQVSLF